VSERITLYKDLVISDIEDSLLDAIGVFGEACYKSRPGICKLCHSKEIEPLEILGSPISRPLFWECQECDYKYLIYSRRKTERVLAIACSFWTSPLDWGYRDKKDFN